MYKRQEPKLPLPSEPLKLITPRLSPLATAVFDPTDVPLDLPNSKYGGFSALLFLMIAILAEVADVPSTCNALSNPPTLLVDAVDPTLNNNRPLESMRSLSEPATEKFINSRTPPAPSLCL